MKIVTYSFLLAIFFTGCQNVNLPNVSKFFKKENPKTPRKTAKINPCQKDFTLMNIHLYKTNKGYFVDLSSHEGSKKHIPLKVLNKEEFKETYSSQCFISPAAWLMITQPKRFLFYSDTPGVLQYKVLKN